MTRWHLPVLLTLLALPCRAAPPKHFATRDFQVFCGEPAGATLSAYAAAAAVGVDLDEARGAMARLPHLGATACVPAERADEIRRRMGPLVDHFDRWGIRPQMPAFGPSGRRVHRLYVHPLGGEDIAYAASTAPPATGRDDTLSSIRADTVRAFGPAKPIDTVYFFLAHEMTHVMQRWSPAIAGSPASASGPARKWVIEGMADAVGFRLLRQATGHWRVDADPQMVRSPTGIRSYAHPLPATDATYGTVGVAGAQKAIDAMWDYRTSSLFTFAMERFGDDDPVFFARLLATPPVRGGDGTIRWVAWLDEALSRVTGRGLPAIYRAFAPHFASWGFTRFHRYGLRDARASKPAYQPAQWLVDAFEGCVEVRLAPGAPATRTLRMAAMTARCLSVTIEAPGTHTARLEVIATGPPYTVVEGLGLGIARAVGATTWDCAARGSKADCEVPVARVAGPGAPLATWTTDPLPLDAGGRGTVIATLASFPERRDKAWRDRTDDITLRVGLRTARVDASVPSPSPPAHTSAVGPLTGALTGVAHRGARPALPLAAADLPATAPAWLDALFARPGLLGTTGVSAAALADAPAGLPGLALYTHAPGDPTPARVFMLVFGQPVPLGFEGITAGHVTGTIDPRRAPPQMVGPPDGTPVPVRLTFTEDRLAARFSAPLCLADLERLGTTPDPAAIADALCVARGTLEADVDLPFGAFYALGAAPPVDPESVRYRPPGDGIGDGTEHDIGDGTGTQVPPSAPDGRPTGGAALACECTCARLAAWRAEGQTLADDAARLTATLDAAALAAGDFIPPALAARVEAHAAFEPCLDRCLDTFATCE